MALTASGARVACRRAAPARGRRAAAAAASRPEFVGAAAAAPPPEEVMASQEFKDKSLLPSREAYDAMYKRSIEDPAGFWGDIAKEFHWETPWDEDNVVNYNFNVDDGPIFVEWFKGGRTNLSYNALDRHVAAGKGDKDCLIWEGNDVGESYTLSYKETLEKVCQVANYLRSVGVKKGDRVCIYMPMINELPIAMLACTRIGAVHSVVFGGFSAEALGQRIVAAEAKVVLTCSAVKRGAKSIGLKSIVDEALAISEKNGFTPDVCLTYDNERAMPRADVGFVEGRDVWWQDAVDAMPTECEVEWMDAEDPLFMLYTSGSTGQPKGVLHTTGGYMLYAATTFKYVFDHNEDDVYWCTADCGWITGHTYLAYGPLLNGGSAVVFEGVPTYPDAGRCWDICDKYNVSVFYTAPTAIRALMRAGDDFVTSKSLKSLRLLGSVGEPINPEAWRWYHEVVGGGRCPIVDTWWQTETGGHMITPLPGAWAQKPGSATLPFFGVQPVICDAEGNELEGAAEGLLAIKAAWPSTMRTIYGDHARYETAYFSALKGYYFSGDGARRDEDGFYWITGRVDDVINVSGHRIGTAEVESALVLHPACAEAAVVGIEHPVKGQSIYAYVSLMDGTEPSDEIRKGLVTEVRKAIGPFASPDVIHWAPGLPKTRSGKIMRRVLRKIATNEEDQLGDTSTLADPGVVDQLIDLRGK